MSDLQVNENAIDKSDVPVVQTTTYRDEEQIRIRTEQHHEYDEAWLKHKHESLTSYLHRLGMRGKMKHDPWNTTTLDTAMEKVLLPLGMFTRRVRDASSMFQARALNSGYRYCCCIDMKRLGTHFKADTAANMTLADLQKSAEAGKGCTRCCLLSQSVAKFEDQWAGVPSSEVIVIGGPETVLGTGSIAVFTIFWVEPEVRRLYPVNHKWSKMAIEIYVNDDAYTLYPNMKPRKKILNDVSAQECAKVIVPWIQKCTEKHLFCNSGQTPPFLPTRLVDIGTTEDTNGIRLVHRRDIQDLTSKFAALSYCWGIPKNRLTPIPVTQTAILADRSNNIPWEELTPVFKDAFALTHALGLRYIWIDAFCIIQDDVEDFAQESSQMASIYGEAHIVFAATRALNGDVGLFHRRPGPQTISHTDRNGKVSSVLVRKQVNHDDFTTGEPRQFTSTPLFARAWCFQERLLARRIIHFAEHELLFECKELLDCECQMLEGADGLYRNFKVGSAYGLAKQSAKSRYSTWYSVLRPYTARSLTYESDRLPALSGFAKLVSIPDMGKYYAGIWENELPGALLWRVVRALPEKNGVIERPDPYRAPTWSWAGVQAVVEGHIQFRDGIETVAHVSRVECVLATSDRFGEVKSGEIVLRARVVVATVVAWVGGPLQKDRPYDLRKGAALEDESSDRIAFDADLDLTAPLPVVCMGIEHDVKGTADGRWSCLVLKRDEVADHYYRVGTIECPSHWLSIAKVETLKVL